MTLCMLRMVGRVWYLRIQANKAVEIGIVYNDPPFSFAIYQLSGLIKVQILERAISKEPCLELT